METITNACVFIFHYAFQNEIENEVFLLHTSTWTEKRVQNSSYPFMETTVKCKYMNQTGEWSQSNALLSQIYIQILI